MKWKNLGKQRGVALVEALIAAAIFGVGLAGIATYQGDLQKEAGGMKAQDEATTLAEEKIADFRNLVDKDEFADIRSSSAADADTAYRPETGLTGTNTSFTRTWTVTNSGDSKIVNVEVAWPDIGGLTQSGCTATGTRCVKMSAVLTWHSTAGEALAIAGGYYVPLDNPHGGGELDPDVDPYTDDELTELEDTGDLYRPSGDDLAIVVTDDGYTQLIDTSTEGLGGDNDVVFQASTTRGFVSLRGYVKWFGNASTCIDAFFYNGTIGETPATCTNNGGLTALNGEPITNSVFSLTSDNSYCVPESTAPVGDDKDRYYFHCYVSAMWYGNLGVVGKHVNDTLCPQRYALPDENDAWTYIYQNTNLVDVNDSGFVDADNDGVNDYAHTLLQTLSNQNFGLVKLQGNDTCDDSVVLIPTSSITITGVLDFSDDANGIEQSNEDKSLLTATPDTECTVQHIWGTNTHTYTCTLDIEQDGWSGHLLLVPGEGLEVCDSNSYYFGAPLTTSYAILGDTFSIRKVGDDTTPCDVVAQPTYEHTVVINIDSSTTNNLFDADVMTFSESGTGNYLDPNSCFAVEVANNNKSAKFHCTVTAPWDTEVTIVPNDNVDGIYVSPNSFTVSTYEGVQDYEDNDKSIYTTTDNSTILLEVLDDP